MMNRTGMERSACVHDRGARTGSAHGRARGAGGCLAWLWLLTLLAGLVMLSGKGFAEAAESPFRLLVFSKTLGYRHASITNGTEAIRELGREHGFTVDATEDSNAFTSTNLARYQVVVFLSATGDVLNPDQETAFKAFVLNGGGFAAIHGAVFGPLACEDRWGWYGDVFCCAFTNHSAIVPAVVHIEDAQHPSTMALPARWSRVDEWYNFSGTPRRCARVLATVDESSYQGGLMGTDHPIAWCRPVGKGRMWYTAMGHTPEAFAEPLFLRHILGGIEAVAARAQATSPPTGL